MTWYDEVAIQPIAVTLFQYKEDTSLRNSECSRNATLLALISSMLHRKLRLTLSCRTCRCKLFESRLYRNTTHCTVAVAVGCWWMLFRLASDRVGGVAKDRSWLHVTTLDFGPAAPFAARYSGHPKHKFFSNLSTKEHFQIWHSQQRNLPDNW